MVKLALFAAVILAASITDAMSSKLPIILPTYRLPPTTGPIIRTVREVNDEPLWLWKGDNIDRAPATGDHPFLPPVIDDIKLNPHQRYVRSRDSPSSKSYGGGRPSGGSRDTGPTHPGYNRRNTRSIRLPDYGRLPKPFDPISPFNPNPPRGPYPIYARNVRDIQFPGIRKPTHRDIIIPNWNPNVRKSPWESLGGHRKSRSLGYEEEEDDVYG